MDSHYIQIAVNNVCVANIIFREKGVLVNNGKVIVDLNSYEFAGRITGDVIVGQYDENEGYHVLYYNKQYEFVKDGLGEDEIHIECYESVTEFEFEYQKRGPMKDFQNNVIKLGDYEISFLNITQDMKEIYKVLKENPDLFIRQ